MIMHSKTPSQFNELLAEGQSTETIKTIIGVSVISRKSIRLVQKNIFLLL